MIEKVKKAIDERERLKKEFEQSEREIIETIASYGVIGVRITHKGSYEAQVFEIEQLEELADGIELDCDNNYSEFHPYCFSFEKEGIKFFSILNEDGYEAYLKREIFDTEHAQAELTQQKRGKSLYEQKLEEAGMEESDFA